MLSDLRAIFAQSGADRLFTRDLLAQLNALPNRPWSLPPFVVQASGCSDSVPSTINSQPSTASAPLRLTKRSLAKRLEAFGIHSRNIRINGTQSKGYDLADFQETFRHLDPGP